MRYLTKFLKCGLWLSVIKTRVFFFQILKNKAVFERSIFSWSVKMADFDADEMNDPWPGSPSSRAFESAELLDLPFPLPGDLPLAEPAPWAMNDVAPIFDWKPSPIRDLCINGRHAELKTMLPSSHQHRLQTAPLYPPKMSWAERSKFEKCQGQISIEEYRRGFMATSSPGNLNSSLIVNADINPSATITDYKKRTLDIDWHLPLAGGHWGPMIADLIMNAHAESSIAIGVSSSSASQSVAIGHEAVASAINAELKSTRGNENNDEDCPPLVPCYEDEDWQKPPPWSPPCSQQYNENDEGLPAECSAEKKETAATTVQHTILPALHEMQEQIHEVMHELKEVNHELQKMNPRPPRVVTGKHHQISTDCNRRHESGDMFTTNHAQKGVFHEEKNPPPSYAPPTFERFEEPPPYISDMDLERDWVAQLPSFSVTIISGKRATGKTTLCHHLVKQKKFSLRFHISSSIRTEKGFGFTNINIENLPRFAGNLSKNVYGSGFSTAPICIVIDELCTIKEMTIVGDAMEKTSAFPITWIIVTDYYAMAFVEEPKILSYTFAHFFTAGTFVDSWLHNHENFLKNELIFNHLPSFHALYFRRLPNQTPALFAIPKSARQPAERSRDCSRVGFMD